MEYNRNTGSIMDEGTALSFLEMLDHSIALYLVTMCCGWAGGRALSCLNPEGASWVRMYFLRKPWQTSSF